MMNKIYLGETWEKSPEVWKNFFIAELEDGPCDIHDVVPIEYINQKLEPHHAQYVATDNNDFLTFETEQDKMFFILKYS